MYIYIMLCVVSCCAQSGFVLFGESGFVLFCTVRFGAEFDYLHLCRVTYIYICVFASTGGDWLRLYLHICRFTYIYICGFPPHNFS